MQLEIASKKNEAKRRKNDKDRTEKKVVTVVATTGNGLNRNGYGGPWISCSRYHVLGKQSLLFIDDTIKVFYTITIRENH
jgi:hypothetical protein